MAYSPSLPYILQDTFHSYPSQTASTLCLTERTLFVRTFDSAKTQQADTDINIVDMVGCQSLVKKLKNNSDRSSYLRIFYYPLVSVGGLLSKQLRRERRIFKFAMQNFDTYDENAVVVKKWQCVIMWLLRGHNFNHNGTISIPKFLPHPHKLLIIVNPHSGPGRARVIFEEQVVPILKESDVEYDLLITDRANYARNYVKSADLSQWNGIVAVSGDGLLFEIFNGLMEREDCDVAVKTPIGIVPGGSGNGLARAINHALGEPYDTSSVTSSVLNIVRGRVSPMDIIEVQTTTVPIYSFLSIGWGLMADIDIESEKLRAIGEARFTLWAVIRALGLRKYKGRLCYLPVRTYEPHCCKRNGTETKVKRSETVGNNFGVSNNYIPQNGNGNHNQPLRSKSFGNDKSEIPVDENNRTVELLRFTHSDEYSSLTKSNTLDFSLTENSSGNEYCQSDDVFSDDACDTSDQTDAEEVTETDVHMSQSTTNAHSRQNISVSPLNEPVPEDWVIVEGEFVLVYVCHQTHISTDLLIAPDAKLDDGIMWLVMIRSDVSRVQVIHFLASLQTGSHIHIPCVDVVPIHAFRLEPSQSDDVLTVDGELIPCGPIQAVVMPSAARIMTR